jgi:hypothetical protein
VKNSSAGRKTVNNQSINRPKTTGLSLCTVDTVAVPNMQRELTLSLQAKLPWEGKCSEQYEENLYYMVTIELTCLAMR